MEPDIRQSRGPAVVLIVTDQPVLAEVVRLALNHGYFTAQVAANTEEAEASLAEGRPHFAVVDADLGDGAILDLLVGASGWTDPLPILALTRRGDLKTKLAAFERGVDDIVTVPFSPEELVARVLAIMRRTYGEAATFTPVIRLGELEIDILHRRVRAGDHDLHLTSIEQSLLYLLAANAGRLMTRDEILDHLWGVDYAAESNVVDRHVRNLRAKLQNDWRRPRYITTVPGQGYRFAPTAED
ncbi:MAG: response regulator transcription factor [Thermomicrobiales bacterium]